MDAFDIGRRLGDLDARSERLESTVTDINGKLDTLVMAAAEKRGEKRMIAFFATAMGGIGSLVMSIIFKLWDN
jgi:hypothetical protein